MKTPRITQGRFRLPTRRLAPIAAVAATWLLGGCATYPEAHVVSAPPPTPPAQIVVVQQPAVVTAPAPGQAATIVVTQAPPAQPQVVVVERPTRPTPEHVWIDGHWTIREGRYHWVRAQWERRPYRDSVWMPPRWENRSDGTFMFYEGYWS